MVDERQPADDHDAEERDLPTADHPLHGKKRPTVLPLVLTVGFIAALILAYVLGVQFLIPAD